MPEHAPDRPEDDNTAVGDSGTQAPQSTHSLGGYFPGAVNPAGDVVGRDKIGIQHVYCGAAPHGDNGVQVALDHYLDRLIHTLSELPLAVISGRDDDDEKREDICLRDVYVPLDTTLQIPQYMRLSSWLATRRRRRRRSQRNESEPPVLYSPDNQRRVSALEALAEHPKLTLIGEAGGGKSSFGSRMLLAMAEALRGERSAFDILGDRWPHGALFPIRVELRRFADRHLCRDRGDIVDDLWDYIESEFAGLGAQHSGLRDALQVRVRQGALVVFDGLDECGNELRRHQVQKAVDAFITAYTGKARFLLTMRPYARPADADPASGLPEAGIYVLADLTPYQTVAFIRDWYRAMGRGGWYATTQEAERRRNGLLAASERVDVASLAQKPLLLTLMALLHSDPQGEGELPDHRVGLYKAAVTLLLQRWRLVGEDARRLGMPPLALDRVRTELERLAFDLHVSSAAHAPDQPMDLHEPALRTALLPLFEYDDTQVTAMLAFVAQRTGILLEQGGPDGLRVYGVAHRSLREYLAACHLAARDDFYAVAQRLALEAPGHWELVLSLAARVASLQRGISVVDALVGRDAVGVFKSSHSQSPGPAQWRVARLAGLQIKEIGRPRFEAAPLSAPVLHRVRHWLAAALPLCHSEGGLPTMERASMGDLLAEVGDPRFDPARLSLPACAHLGFIRIPEDSNFRIGTHSEHLQRMTEIVGHDLYRDEINDTITPTPEFWIARYPVTVAQLRAFVEESGYVIAHAYALHGPENRPVRYVNWVEAKDYVTWLEKQLREAPVFDTNPIAVLVRAHGWQVMLPSERVWEKAARGGHDGKAFPWGDTCDSDLANTFVSKSGDGAAVGVFPANDYGLHDMVGDVCEWTQTEYEYSYSSPEREATAASESIVVRGGAWAGPRFASRCADRYRRHPDLRSDDLGFRVVLCRSPIR